jgi:hypothetical protein
MQIKENERSIDYSFTKEQGRLSLVFGLMSRLTWRHNLTWQLQVCRCTYKGNVPRLKLNSYHQSSDFVCTALVVYDTTHRIGTSEIRPNGVVRTSILLTLPCPMTGLPFLEYCLQGRRSRLPSENQAQHNCMDGSIFSKHPTSSPRSGLQ